jgi:nicotinate-nucleotide adenylyltransferase
MVKKKIILFGGTFDPVHLGHTSVTATASERIGAEKVIFVPAKQSPLKAFGPQVCDEDRLAMIKLAIESNNAFDVSDYELKKPGPSYTLETVIHYQQQLGDEAMIFWLAGADSLDDLPGWYGVKELIDRCNLSIMHRAGCKPPDFSKYQPLWGPDRVRKLQQNVVETPLIDISSTEVRRRISAGLDVNAMLNPKVQQYIREHGLYGCKSED